VVILFRFISKTQIDLQIQIRNDPRPVDNADQSRSPTAARDKILNFKLLMLAYIFGLMIIALFELLFLQNYPWISEMMKELLEVQGVICIGMILRLRPTNVYYALEDENDPPAYFRQPIEMSNMQQGAVALNVL